MSKTNANCVFCKIVAGAIPSARVYEDERCLAFMDIGPLAPGHTLLIPKDHHELVTDLPDETAAALGRAMPRLARAVMAATQAEGFNIYQTNKPCAGQVVPHVHFHIIPRRESDGLGFRWKGGEYAAGEAQQWSKRIADCL